MSRELCKICHGVGEGAYMDQVGHDIFVETLKDCTFCGGTGLERLPSLFVQKAVTNSIESAVKALGRKFGSAV